MDNGPAAEALAPPPLRAAELCGDRLELVRAYAELLAAEGPMLGLVGPREVPRLWDRHILNCAVVAPLASGAGSLLDVGSGGGLPGVVLACLLPDTQVMLLEPMLRRSDWLRRVADELGLERVTVERARAEDVRGRVAADVVTARAVAPLAQLVEWCLPLTAPGGRVLALKGERAADELMRDSDALRAAGVTASQVLELGGTVLDVPTRVVEIRGRWPGVDKPRQRRSRARTKS